MDIKPINTGLIGYGLSGRVFHAPFLQLSNKFGLASIAQRTSDSSKASYPDARAVRSIEEIINNPDIELVVVAAPNEFHYNMAKMVLQAGKHVIIEKPFASTVAETDELISLAEKNNKCLFIFHNRRWDSDFLTIKQILDNQLLGEIVSYEAHYNRYKPALHPKPWKEEVGPTSGILFDLGTHIIDQAICLFGAPISVSARLLRQRQNTQIDDGFDLILDYGPFTATLRSTLLEREPGPRYIINGLNGSFVKYGIDPQEDDMQAGLSPLSDNWGKEKEENWGVLNTTLNGLDIRGTVASLKGDYMQFYENVYDVIRNNADYAITPQSAQITTMVIESAYESHRSKKSIILTSS